MLQWRLRGFDPRVGGEGWGARTGGMGWGAWAGVHGLRYLSDAHELCELGCAGWDRGLASAWAFERGLETWVAQGLEARASD